jgi:hypothetical protein
MLDAISGESITAAFQSGQWAGEAVAAFLGEGPLLLPAYSERLVAHFGAVYASTPLRKVWSNLCGLSLPFNYPLTDHTAARAH